MNGPDLRELRVLVVEDESLVTMLIEDTLIEAGCFIAGVASGLDEALEKLSSLSFDVAILDVNLNGAQTFPVAEILMERHIPFVFSTGYGVSGIPAAFRQVPILAKPFQERDLIQALTAAVDRAG